MTDKEFRRLSRSDLIEIIYQLQISEENLQDEIAGLEQELEDRRAAIGQPGTPEETKDRQREEIPLPSAEQIREKRRRLRRGKQFWRILGNTVSILVVVAAVAVLLVTLFLPVLQVSGDSMEPTLEDGDVIVLVKTSDFDTGDLCAVRVSGKVLLKRMIAGPGDWVNIDSEGNVYVNGETLDEPYVTDKALGINDRTYPYQIPDGCIFVLGDHRSVSVDSRSSEVGCIPYEQVIGRVIMRIWPLAGISRIT